MCGPALLFLTFAHTQTDRAVFVPMLSLMLLCVLTSCVLLWHSRSPVWMTCHANKATLGYVRTRYNKHAKYQ